MKFIFLYNYFKNKLYKNVVDMKINIGIIISFLLSLNVLGQCEGDYTVVVSNFEFYPSELTISPDETIAFVNIEGNHTLNGLTNSITGDSFNNPTEIFLEQTTGNSEGVCMGVVNFDTAGTYSFDCSVGYNAEAGMSLNVIVDPFDLNDLMIDLHSNQDVPIFFSQYAFSTFTDTFLTQSAPWTIFVPDNDAVYEILEYMNLGQFDGLNIPDLTQILEYHIVYGIWDTEQLFDGQELLTAQGQSLSIFENEQEIFVNGSKLISTNFEAYNGMVHVIDSCLAPVGLPESTVMEIIRKSEDHQFLEEAIIEIGLDDDLSTQVTIDNSIEEPGPWTIFAPTDSAFSVFAEIIGIPIDELINSQFLYNFTSNHIFENAIYSDELSSGISQAININGTTINFDFENSSYLIVGQENTAQILITDLYAYNGVVHVIDAVIRPNLPDINGTCGTWELKLESNSENGWGEDELQLFINDILVEKLSVFEGNNERVYQFGVDLGDKIDLYYVQNGFTSISSQSFLLYNETGEVLINATPTGTYNVLANYTNILACEALDENHCGTIKIKTIHNDGFGWYGGSLEVYNNGIFLNEINMILGYNQFTFLNVNYNDTLNIIVNNPVFPELSGYIVYGLDQQIVFEDNVSNTIPQNSPFLTFCDKNNKSWDCVNNFCIERNTIVGEFSSLNECQKQCETSFIENNALPLEIYPNPSNGRFNISFNQNTEINAQITITNILGEIVYINEFNEQENQYSKTIDIGNKANGIYMLSITTNTQNIIKKIIVQ